MILLILILVITLVLSVAIANKFSAKKKEELINKQQQTNVSNSSSNKQNWIEKGRAFQLRMDEIQKKKEELRNKREEVLRQQNNKTASPANKQEWAKKMAEYRKQKRLQREQEEIERNNKLKEKIELEREKFAQLKSSFNKIGVSLESTDAYPYRNNYKIYASENVDLESLFDLIKQASCFSYISITECVIEDFNKNCLLRLDDEFCSLSFLQEEKGDKQFATPKQLQNFLFCYLGNRKIKRLEILWGKIIEHGLIGGDKLPIEGMEIEDKVYYTLKSSDYQSIFEPSLECLYETGMLIIDYELPDLSKFPAIKEYKYISASNEINIKKQSDTYITKEYEKALYSITLRTIYEAYHIDNEDKINSITFNGFVSSINPSTGLMERKCVLSIQVSKEKFAQINLANVDPKSCFKALKGVSAAKLITLSPITPILTFNKNDKRFVQERQIATNQGTNLASMHWEDFEQLVRELFELEFAQNGSEVKVTQASRDGGVDAVVFDPDPLRGGKIVIQAKRYTNTVGVSAVRDLYGTVINEGANTGILITTSDYGHDSYEFAKDKPLKLLNGGHLLALLLKNGRKAYINIEEAKIINKE